MHPITVQQAKPLKLPILDMIVEQAQTAPKTRGVDFRIGVKELMMSV